MDQGPEVPSSPSQSNSHPANNGGGGGGGGHGHSPTNDDNETEDPQNNETGEQSGIQTTNFVSVFPERTNTSPGHLFSIAILCEPVEPIKSWELTLDYDPSYLYADSVIQGNIFEGYPVFSSPNILIDNVNGTITRLYSLIIGPGLMTNKTGILCIFEFTSLMMGITYLNIEMIGLTNDTGYLPVETRNGTIDIFIIG